MPPDNISFDTDTFARRALIAVGVTASVIILVLFLWQTVWVLLLVFLGILLAVLLHGLSDLVARHTPLSERWSLTLVLILFFTALVLGVWQVAPYIIDQLTQLADRIPQAVNRVEQRLENYPWVQDLLRQIPSPSDLVTRQFDFLGRLTGALSITFSILLNVILILFLALFLAAQPRLYQQGFVRLVPIKRRARAEAILSALGYTLRHWFIGRLVSMAVVGVLTAGGLWMLEVPLAFTLGLLAAVLGIVPYIGPIVAAVPGILLAFLQGPQQVLYVTLLYFAVQQIEGYLVTPLVQQHEVTLPPAITIVSLVVFGLFFGIVGLIVATPLTAVVLVLVKMIYVEDILGDPLDSSGGRAGS